MGRIIWHAHAFQAFSPKRGLDSVSYIFARYCMLSDQKPRNPGASLRHQSTTDNFLEDHSVSSATTPKSPLKTSLGTAPLTAVVDHVSADCEDVSKDLCALSSVTA